MCWYCGTSVTEAEPIGRNMRCLCGKDLRCCRHCRFFLPGSRGDCSEPNAERPGDKERANFCDWFSLDQKFRIETAGQKNESNKAAAAKKNFDNLFN